MGSMNLAFDTSSTLGQKRSCWVGTGIGEHLYDCNAQLCGRERFGKASKLCGRRTNSRNSSPSSLASRGRACYDVPATVDRRSPQKIYARRGCPLLRGEGGRGILRAGSLGRIAKHDGVGVVERLRAKNFGPNWATEVCSRSGGPCGTGDCGKTRH